MHCQLQSSIFVKITLQNMKFYAYHGFYEEEQLIGGHYTVDVSIEANVGKAAADDDLYQTVNYETIYFIVKREMQQPTKLIEAISERIVTHLKGHFPKMQQLAVRIEKLHPPLGGSVGAAIVLSEHNFQKKCARCRSAIICYADPLECWCKEKKASENLRHSLSEQFAGCLCKSCLKEFGGW